MTAGTEVYHVELRQFPHNVCRFNLDQRELWATVLARWARDEWVEVGERKWNPQQARLTVLQGPRLELAQLSLGRGWRAAQRSGRDVTEEVIAAARTGEDHVRAGGVQSRDEMGSSGGTGPGGGMGFGGEAGTPAGADPVADSLGLEVLAALGTEEAPLRRVWELAGERHPQRRLGERLTLAEHAVLSLLRAGLVVLNVAGAEGGDARAPLAPAQAQARLGVIDSWLGPGEDAAREADVVWIARS